LILRLETRLDSGSSRVSDRFTARVIEPILDGGGKVLVPAGSVAEGYITSVTPAQSRRRSGIIAVSFDKLRLLDGREFAISGALTSAEASERQRIDEEGSVAGGRAAGRSIVFIGGGAASGAVIGAITGGAALGAGLGAAAGALGALLAKGQEAVVVPGTRLGLKLLRPLDLGPSAGGIAPVEAGRPQGEAGGIKRAADAQQSGTRAPAGSAEPVRVSHLQAERASDGSVRVLVTAETPTSGWRVYADHSVDRDTLEVWLRGGRPPGLVAQVISHPTVSLSVPDEAGAIRRVMVHGANGDRTADLAPRPALSGEARAKAGARIEDQITALLADYAASLGITRRGDAFEFDRQRRLSETEIGLLFALSNLADSVRLFRSLAEAQPGAESLRGGALRLSLNAQEVNQLWSGLRLAEGLDQQWRAVIEEIRLLSDAAARD
jgi:hypothetical protein